MPGVREQKGIPSTELFNLYILFSQTRPRERVYVMHVCMLARFFEISRVLNGENKTNKLQLYIFRLGF